MRDRREEGYLQHKNLNQLHILPVSQVYSGPGPCFTPIVFRIRGRNASIADQDDDDPGNSFDVLEHNCSEMFEVETGSENDLGNDGQEYQSCEYKSDGDETAKTLINVNQRAGGRTPGSLRLIASGRPAHVEADDDEEGEYDCCLYSPEGDERGFVV